MDGRIFWGIFFLRRIFRCIFNHGCRCVVAGYLRGQVIQVYTCSPCAQGAFMFFRARAHARKMEYPRVVPLYVSRGKGERRGRREGRGEGERSDSETILKNSQPLHFPPYQPFNPQYQALTHSIFRRLCNYFVARLAMPP